MTDDDFTPAPDEPEPAPITRPAHTSQRAPERQLPHSTEAEEHVLACCLLEGDDGLTLKRALDAGITDESFYSPANRIIFSILRTLPEPSLEILAAELTTRRQLEAVGGYPRLIQITGQIPTTAHAGYFIQKVRELHLLRETIKAATRTVEEAYGYTGGLDEFLQTATARMEAVRTGTDLTHRADKLKSLHAHRVCAATPPAEPQTRLFLADKPICTPGNITTLISRAKTGKTAALGAATAAMIAATTSTLDRDTFKFRATNPNGHAVIVIDTEQSPYDAYQCYHRSLLRSGDPTDPPWLHHYSLVGYSAHDLKEALDLALSDAAARHHGIFAVILDGVADFVLSVNDEAESNAFVTWLRSRTVTYDCPAICVIHSNEAEKSGDDGRGHLGKQLIRKAESNLLLKKDGEVTTITSDKQRKAPITKKDNVAFRWDDTAQMHVSCDSGEPQSESGGRKRKHSIEEFMACIPKPGERPMTGTQLHRFAIQVAEIKPQTFKDLLNEAAQDGVLIKSFDQKTGYSYVRAI